MDQFLDYFTNDASFVFFCIFLNLGVKIYFKTWTFFESPLKFRKIFYLQDNLNTIESLLCIFKSTLDLKKMQWHWFWKDGWKALMEIWTPSAWLLHFGSKQKTYILLFLALPHETLMSKHFKRVLNSSFHPFPKALPFPIPFFFYDETLQVAT